MTSHEAASVIDSPNSSPTKIPSIWFSPLFDKSQGNCWNQSTDYNNSQTLKQLLPENVTNPILELRKTSKIAPFHKFSQSWWYCGKFNYHPSLQCSSLELWQFKVYLYNYPNAENAVINPHWLIGLSRDPSNFINLQDLKQSNRT